ncbi:tetratricopeptide repeat protein [Actinoplanes sp. NPDC049265]|uniref:tetratricopeptide repeat protein n=1 Tax=Actinoplanes sp. NPDC049265 TaxID=3363902 RepID=UPI00372408EC
MTDTAARRGRREAELDETVPANLRDFAQRLRDLRAECGNPPYRVLSGLAHCATSTLSEAAGGRRLPSWETTRAYVIGCLRHAGRTDELVRELPRWEARWHQAGLAPDASPAPMPFEPGAPAVAELPGVADAPAVAGVAAAPARRTRTVTAVVAALVAVAAVVAGDQRSVPTPMAGAFNVLVLTAAGPSVARALDRDLRAWAGDSAAIQIKALADPPGADLAGTAAEQNADVVLRPSVRPAGARTVTTVEIFLGDRPLGETPEFGGRHDLTLTEPAGTTGELSDATRHYLAAVVSFVRGLGAYADDDYETAESHFVRAGTELELIGAEVRGPVVHRAVVDLMAGNAAGRRNPQRSIAYFQRALEAQPGYGRALVGLAEAYRAGVNCRPGADVSGLDRAEENYRAYLSGPPESGLLGLKAHLGLGLGAACRGQHGSTRGAYTAADREFGEVLRLRPAVADSAHARWLAAEATAGLGLDALLARGDDATAAGRYEQAIALMETIDAPLPVYLRRELVFLTVLRGCYERLDQPNQVLETSDRMLTADRRLTELTAGR